VDVVFELIWRRGETDLPIATWEHHFEPIGAGEYTAQPYEETADAPAFDFEPGDQLVFRYTGDGAPNNAAYIPNGDGATTNGRIPYIELPQ
jgi:hypothetical protein